MFLKDEKYRVKFFQYIINLPQSYLFLYFMGSNSSFTQQIYDIRSTVMRDGVFIWLFTAQIIFIANQPKLVYKRNNYENRETTL